MANPTQNTNLFSNLGGNSTPTQTTSPFGVPATSGPSSSTNIFESAGQKPLFGGSAAQSGGFGALGQGNSQSVFGASSSSNSEPPKGAGFSFGSAFTMQKPQEPATGSPFGAFSTPSKNADQTAPMQNQSHNIFTNPSGGSSLPATSQGQTTPTTKPSFNFPNPSTTPAGPPPSSAFAVGTNNKNGSSLFGGLGKPNEQQSQSAPSTAPLFGAQATQPATSSTEAPSLFASNTTKSGTSLFGNSSAASQAEPPKTSPFTLGGGNNQTSSAANTSVRSESKAGGFVFPSTNPNTISAPAQTTSLHTSAEKSSLFPSATSANFTPSLFSGLSSKADAPGQTAPSSSLFSGFTSTKPAESPAISQSASAAPTLTGTDPSAPGTTTPAATTTAQSTSLFATLGNKANETGQSKETPTTTAASATGSIGLATHGSSNVGPAPNAQSRLKNKSMDDIITRWAADLSRYQKEFQAQAEKVAAWDRMLLENGNAISKLYAKTFQAERDTAEVQKQLSTVEGQQDELAEWLDRYEREVDEMMARQVGPGEGLQGPDQERERTYQSAERISDRLQDMNKDLTSMIDDINAASASISNTSKADDPLSQIVRILNGHLSQLQSIDQGTASLQAKLATAKKENQRLDGRKLSGYDAADDFYRSYMSRS